MAKWLKRIRAAIGMGVVWGVAWLGAGLVMLLIVGPGAADVPFPLFFGFLGFLAGATFSGILGLVGRRRRFEEMSLAGFAGWGALGGLLLSGIVNLIAGPGGDMLVVAPVFAIAGAISAMGTLMLARRAEESRVLES
jgi:hypothetical protein